VNLSEGPAQQAFNFQFTQADSRRESFRLTGPNPVLNAILNTGYSTMELITGTLQSVYETVVVRGDFTVVAATKVGSKSSKNCALGQG
jgi:uncharacterized UBP type Zn finger protein